MPLGKILAVVALILDLVLAFLVTVVHIAVGSLLIIVLLLSALLAAGVVLL